MPGIQVLNFQQRVAMSKPLVKHLLGINRPETAIQRDGIPPVVLFDRVGTIIDLEQAQKQYEESQKHLAGLLAEQAKRRGRRSDGVVDFVLAGLDWNRDKHGKAVKFVGPQLHAWARKNIQFFARNLGSQSRIAVASIHLDEKSPHLHLLTVCANEQRRLGWANVRNSLAGLPPDDVIRNRRDGKSKTRGRRRVNFREVARLIHTRLHEEVSRHFELKRGRILTEIVTRQPIDRAKSVRDLVDEGQRVGFSQGADAQRDVDRKYIEKVDRQAADVAAERDQRERERDESERERARVAENVERLERELRVSVPELHYRNAVSGKQAAEGRAERAERDLTEARMELNDYAVKEREQEEAIDKLKAQLARQAGQKPPLSMRLLPRIPLTRSRRDVEGAAPGTPAAEPEPEPRRGRTQSSPTPTPAPSRPGPYTGSRKDPTHRRGR